MNILRAFAIFSFLVIPCATWAKTALVQSGEHADFSRLVTDLPPDTTWSVDRDGTKVSLQFRGHKDGFDTARVFEFIPRSRISDVGATEDTLTLSLTCDCNVSAFVHRGIYVVMDVAETGVELSAPVIERNAGTKQGAVSPVFGVNQLAKWHNTAPPNPALSSEPNQDAHRSGPELKQMQEQLATELGLATTRGILDPRKKRPLVRNGQPHIDIDRLPVPATDGQTDLPKDRTQDARRNMRISSSMDLPEAGQTGSNAFSLSGQNCSAGGSPDLGKWGTDDSFHKQIGRTRQALYGEFDTLNADAALQLAQLYLHFGFGAEAIQALRIEQYDRPQNGFLTSIAEILEYGRPSAPQELRQMLGCSDEATLWAILAFDALDIETIPEVEAALRALNRLPVHLRQIVAPLMVDRLRESGEVESAEKAIRSLGRLPDEMPTAGKLANAKLEVEKGDAEEGAKQLDQVVRKNAPQSPDALIAFVEAKLTTGHAIDPETVDLVAAYAKELQGSPIGNRMRHTHVLALARSLQFDTAYREAAALGGEAGDEAALELRQFLLSELTRNADDVVFLDHALKHSDRDILELDVQQRLALAERLIALGFAETSQRVIASIPDRPRDPRRQMLSARIAMALQQPFKAKAELIGIEGEAADLLRAKASEIAGVHEDAYAFYQSASDPEDARRSAWLAGEWDSASLAADPVLGPVAALTASRPVSSFELDGLLTRSSEQLEESALARAALTALLNAPELQVAPLDAQ